MAVDFLEDENISVSSLNALYLNTPRLCLYKYYSKGRYHVERSFLGAVLYFGWPNQSFFHVNGSVYIKKNFETLIRKLRNLNLKNGII